MYPRAQTCAVKEGWEQTYIFRHRKGHSHEIVGFLFCNLGIFNQSATNKANYENINISKKYFFALHFGKGQ